MIGVVFESTYGYNNTLRLGKIYIFTSLDTIKYLLEVNRDLIVLNYKFNQFIRLARKSLHNKKVMKLIRSRIKPNHHLEIQLGKTWRQIFSELNIPQLKY